MITADQIEEAALELPRDELGALIERLVARAADEWDEDPHWRREILRRSAEIEAGTAQSGPSARSARQDASGTRTGTGTGF
ncbi:MAG TPA: hypothetical protein VF665_19645 [Longimicrobium sp.]|jgi:hypothetical protein|uniref:hypothetical protein n=1 Tax=Longimicrobium sp. TaxID=2029185 RepID=UPI002ED879AC